jgi:hypothetical protein
MKKNTLSKKTTVRFYKTNNGYEEITALWKGKIAEGFQPNAYHLLSYAILRGKDYRKGFSPIINQVKLDNGMSPLQALHSAASTLLEVGFSGIFSEHLSKGADAVLREVFPESSKSRWFRRDYDYAYNEEAECLTSMPL